MSSSLAASANPWTENWQKTFDPFQLGPIINKAQHAWLEHPSELAAAWEHWWGDALRWQGVSWASLLGGDCSEPFSAHSEDERFKASSWQNEAQWVILKNWYLFNTRWLQDSLFATPGLSPEESKRAAFWLRQWLNAVAPTNFLALNPAALERAWQTGGASLRDGFNNLLRDAAIGDIAMTDRDAFKVGVNLATTEGAVVYRGRLLEVLHYQASGDKVHRVPMVIISPWINKYYVLDLDPSKSMVKFLVDQGFSVFVTSWKNPGEEYRDTGFDDYLTDGIARIVDVARSISGSEQVHLTGYCIGGTLTTAYIAWLAARNEASRIASTTLLTTLTDFSAPGDIDVFVQESGLDYVDYKMDQQGYLDGKDMAASFRMLRANSLIWHYWINNYLLGETPRPFDILYWNMDTTRMPARMHSFYLHEFYQHNKLCQPNALTLAGSPIDLGRIETPLYIVSAEEDHIAPWRQTWTLIDRVSGPVTFTLTNSGHILGIINPPSPKSRRQFWQQAPEHGESPEQWLSRQEAHPGSWWNNWADWLRPKSGPEVKFKLDNSKYPALCPAPGQYVLE
ncbi:PHA/PHB synthase family protein [Paludibacterium yongneupense]|uniref:PHA/PHB synthase family protein n=1 Tax=Paludibacterium yongneupense TaxID=400061 RepID=UPI000410134C|nr:alpha/beta fold hydrolase [Paludibacterium yongneupense]